MYELNVTEDLKYRFKSRWISISYLFHMKIDFLHDQQIPQHPCKVKIYPSEECLAHLKITLFCFPKSWTRIHQSLICQESPKIRNNFQDIIWTFKISFQCQKLIREDIDILTGTSWSDLQHPSEIWKGRQGLHQVTRNINRIINILENLFFKL